MLLLYNLQVGQVRIHLLDEMWGPVNLLRQTRYYSGKSSRAYFDTKSDESLDYDYVFVPNEHKLSAASKFSKNKRFHICMENPDIWSPSYEFLSQMGFIFTPFPEAINSLPSDCQIIQSYPCVPWFYDIDFSVDAGLTHVPLHSRSELSELLSFPMPRKKKLLSIIISSKSGGPGYLWRTRFARALKSFFGECVDVYGFGHNPLMNKKDALDQYLATIVLENEILYNRKNRRRSSWLGYTYLLWI